MHCVEGFFGTLEHVEARIHELESLLLIPMETEEETLALLLEYMELDHERDERAGEL